MRVERAGGAAFTAEFESEQELREEHRLNLSQGALRLPTAETVPLHATLLITLRGPWGGEAHLRATAVAELPNAIALAVEKESYTRLSAGRATNDHRQLTGRFLPIIGSSPSRYTCAPA